MPWRGEGRTCGSAGAQPRLRQVVRRYQPSINRGEGPKNPRLITATLRKTALHTGRKKVSQSPLSRVSCTLLTQDRRPTPRLRYVVRLLSVCRRSALLPYRRGRCLRVCSCGAQICCDVAIRDLFAPLFDQIRCL